RGFKSIPSGTFFRYNWIIAFENNQVCLEENSQNIITAGVLNQNICCQSQLISSIAELAERLSVVSVTAYSHGRDPFKSGCGHWSSLLTSALARSGILFTFSVLQPYQNS